MPSALPLRAALKRGALVTAANWPVVLIDFTIESVYKIALAVPVVGGAFMVAVLVGADLRVFFNEGVQAAAGLVVDALSSAPIALASFLVAGGIVAFGGGVMVFALKAGTLNVLVTGERTAGELHRGALDFEALRRAYAYEPGALLAAVRRFARRAVTLLILLSVAYAAIAGVWTATVTGAIRLAADTRWAPVWPLLVVIATSASVVAIAITNLVYDLLRVVVVTDDVQVRVALRRLRAFLVADARQVLGIFGVVAALLLAALAVSVLVAGGLTFVAWVPVAGLIAVPLQFAAWLVRGLVFQYVALTALSAYQTQYRRFATPDTRSADSPRWIQQA